MTISENDFKKLKDADVMSTPPVVDDEYELKLDLLQNSRLNLKLPNHAFESLRNAAEYKNQSIEEYACSILVDSLEQKVGAAWITGPSVIGSTPLPQVKVKGPTYSVTREDS